MTAAPLSFFQPDYTYSGSHGWKFRVDIITTHPEDGEQTALGWRFFNGVWEPYAYGVDDWELIRLAGHTDLADHRCPTCRRTFEDCTCGGAR